MMFLSRISRSLSHSSRSVLSGNLNGLRILSPTRPVFENACFPRADGGVRNHMTCTEGTKKVSCGQELKHLVSNPRLVRLFSTQALNKNYGKNLPKGTNETPKEGSGGRWVCFVEFTLLAIIYWLLAIKTNRKTFVHLPCTFEELKNEMLQLPGLVDRIVVSDNGIAHVYLNYWFVKSGSVTHVGDSDKGFATDFIIKKGVKIAFYLKIGSVECFEENLKEAQQALGIHPSDYVRVRYENQWKFRLTSKFF